MNANTKNLKMDHCPCPGYGMIYKPDLHILQVRKKHLKIDQEIKFTFENRRLLNNLKYKHCPKFSMAQNEMYNLQTRFAQFLQRT